MQGYRRHQVLSTSQGGPLSGQSRNHQVPPEKIPGDEHAWMPDLLAPRSALSCRCDGGAASSHRRLPAARLPRTGRRTRRHNRARTTTPAAHRSGQSQLSLMPGRSAHRARRAPQASGHVDHESQLIWRAELGNQASSASRKSATAASRVSPLAIGSHAGTQLGVRAPHAVLVLRDDIRDMHGPGHRGLLP